MKTRNFDDFIQRDLEREIARHERLLKKQQQSQKPPAPQPSAHFLSQAPSKPLTWLWPGRIPFGQPPGPTIPLTDYINSTLPPVPNSSSSSFVQRTG